MQAALISFLDDFAASRGRYQRKPLRLNLGSADEETANLKSAIPSDYTQAPSVELLIALRSE